MSDAVILASGVGAAAAVVLAGSLLATATDKDTGRTRPGRVVGAYVLIGLFCVSWAFGMARMQELSATASEANRIAAELSAEYETTVLPGDAAQLLDGDEITVYIDGKPLVFAMREHDGADVVELLNP